VGVVEADRALAIVPNHVAALVYKDILLRRQARHSIDPERRRQLIAEADRLRARAEQLQASR
jgi:hypothetical protein